MPGCLEYTRFERSDELNIRLTTGDIVGEFHRGKIHRESISIHVTYVQ